MNDRVHENFWFWISGYDDAPSIIRLKCQSWINRRIWHDDAFGTYFMSIFLAGKTADIAAKNGDFA